MTTLVNKYNSNQWRINGFFIFTVMLTVQLFLQNRKIFRFLYEPSWCHILWSISIVILLLFPKSFRMFLLVMVGILWYCYARLPAPSNHVLFLAFTAIIILTCFILQFFSPRRYRDHGKFVFPDGTLVYNTAAPSLRVILLILYFWAAFHKMNSGFFDPTATCALSLARKLSYLTNMVGLEGAIEIPKWMTYNFIYGTLVIEVLIPILLVFRKTRLLGVLIGVPFHAVFGVIGFYTFSTMIYAFYALFLPDEFFSLMDHYRRLIRSRWPWVRQWMVGASVIITGLTFFYIWQSPLISYGTLFWLVIILIGYPVLVWLVVSNWSRLNADQNIFRQRRILPVVITIIVFLNGLSPYLGLKTTTCFSMFSNLMTEERYYNHFIIPQDLFRIASYQDDLVTIVNSNSKHLNSNSQKGFQLTYFEFHRFVYRAYSQGYDFKIIYKRNGETFYLNSIGDDPELSTPQPWFLQKFLHFREVGKSCNW